MAFTKHFCLIDNKLSVSQITVLYLMNALICKKLNDILLNRYVTVPPCNCERALMLLIQLISLVFFNNLPHALQTFRYFNIFKCRSTFG